MWSEDSIRGVTMRMIVVVISLATHVPLKLVLPVSSAYRCASFRQYVS